MRRREGVVVRRWREVERREKGARVGGEREEA